VDDLAAEAIGVLCANDRVGWTRPSPRLYPHQWSWDAAFVAIGWAHFAPLRAVTELRSLFRGQWSNGMVPQIVFDNGVALGAKGHVLDRTEFFHASVRSDRSVKDFARFAIRFISDVLCKRG